MHKKERQRPGRLQIESAGILLSWTCSP